MSTMNYYLSRTQLNILSQVARRQFRRETTPIVISTKKGETLTKLMSYLPYYLGKGKLRGFPVLTRRDTKPILIITTGAIQLSQLLQIFGTQSFLKKASIMECTEGVPYAICLTPTTNDKEIEDYDVVLTETYHYSYSFHFLYHLHLLMNFKQGRSTDSQDQTATTKRLAEYLSPPTLKE